jgi:hypothetical protein
MTQPTPNSKEMKRQYAFNGLQQALITTASMEKDRNL